MSPEYPKPDAAPDVRIAWYRWKLGVMDELLQEAYDESARLRAALQSLTEDPPPTFAREPDTDAEVIVKMRWIARRALEDKP